MTAANDKQVAFLNRWVNHLVTTQLPQQGNPGGGGQQPGGQQKNPAIIARVRALQAAYNDFLQTPWTNPLPANWNS